jgi:L-alanine-DL-glutamate epimerase-like enolase superfamily enzyme
MRLSLRIGSAPIPFRMSFGHAAAERSRAENIIAVIEDRDGVIGLGEGCPRSYVTGEDVPSALAFLDARRSDLSSIDRMGALQEWRQANEGEIDANPSAFCAVELAFLDLFARRSGQSVETMLGVQAAAPAIRATAIYSTGGDFKFAAQALLFAANGMAESKLKLSGDSARDLRRAASLARRGRLRLDANNMWSGAAQAIPALQPLAAHAWAVEEPIGVRDWEGLGAIAAQTGLRIILDESMLCRADLDAASAGSIANLRVSKLGGLLRALDCLNHARGEVIVGAQVGETSILARAGLVLAKAAGARLAGYEGGYAPHLLAHDAVRPSLGFGRAGEVRDAAFKNAPGWGLALRHDTVRFV